MRVGDKRIMNAGAQSIYGAFQLGLVVKEAPLGIPVTYSLDMALPCPRECGLSNQLYPH